MINVEMTVVETVISCPIYTGGAAHAAGDGTDHAQVAQNAADIATLQGQAHNPVTAGAGISVVGQQVANADGGAAAVSTHEGNFAHADIAGTKTRADNLESKVGSGATTKATLKNYVETAAQVTSSAGVVTLNLATAASLFYITLTENVTSVVLTNVPAGVVSVSLEVTQHASSPKTWAWGAGWQYHNSTAPVVTATANKKDFFRIYTRDQGTTKVAAPAWSNVG